MTKAFVKNTKKYVNMISRTSPYPDMGNKRASFEVLETESETLNINYGEVKDIYPYTQQDLYDCAFKKKTVKTVVLENKYIRATFLPEYGARLMSIYHKKQKKELVYNNEKIRIANIALRNAWFAGGVEWNTGMRGHTPFTCDNVFCEIIDGKDSPVVRFYEFERVRRQMYEVCAYLPKNSEQLYIKCRIINLNNEESPAYWWSNIAVKETIGMRVISNCEYSYNNNYEGKICLIPVPYRDGYDYTYPVRNLIPSDFFFRTFEDKQKFIMTAEENGDAFYQTSTDLLKGRKEFVWGMMPGGFAWQKKLCGGSDTYIEVQAGLARTQMKCVAMPPHSQWEWTEAYGMTKVDIEKIFDGDWAVAREEGARCVEKEVSREKLEKIGKEITEVCKNKRELVHAGSPWMSLEKKISYDKVFEDFAAIDLSAEQLPWVKLIEEKVFEAPDKVTENPAGYVKDKKLMSLLEEVADNWYAYFHLGAMKYSEDDISGARKAFEKSIKLKRNPWALYGLGVLLSNENNFAAGAECMEGVLEFNKNDIRVLKKLFDYSAKAGICEKYLTAYNKLSGKVKENGRIKIMAAGAYLEIKDIKSFEAIIAEKFEIADVREGEISLRVIWEKYIELKYVGDNMTQEQKELTKKEHPIPYWMAF